VEDRNGNNKLNEKKNYMSVLKNLLILFHYYSLFI
jgi:hypothetical protein